MNTLHNTATTPANNNTIGAFVADRPCLRVAADCPVDTVLNIMSHCGSRVAGVVGPDRTLCGFLTRSVIFGHLALGADLSVRTETIRAMEASEVMIKNPAFLPSELDLADALSLMAENGFQYMPVLGDDAALIGIADLRDLALERQDAARQEVEEKDNLLGWLMGHEPYGLCGAVANPRTVETGRNA